MKSAPSPLAALLCMLRSVSLAGPEATHGQAAEAHAAPMYLDLLYWAIDGSISYPTRARPCVMRAVSVARPEATHIATPSRRCRIWWRCWLLSTHPTTLFSTRRSLRPVLPLSQAARRCRRQRARGCKSSSARLIRCSAKSCCLSTPRLYRAASRACLRLRLPGASRPDCTSSSVKMSEAAGQGQARVVHRKRPSRT